MITKPKVKNQFYIEMFGQFCISGQGKSLDEDEIRSDMLIKLITYIYCHRKKELAVQELVEALWDEDESANPAGALKNLVYRLRTMLKKAWPEYEFIITRRGAYKWNEEVPIASDMEVLEKGIARAAKESNPEKQAAIYLQALDVYKGPFLPKIGGEHWIAPWTTHYHSMYISTVKTVAELLEEQQQYEQMERVCNYALQMDQLSEELYCCVIRALVKQKKIKLAEKQYKKAVDILYENLGVSPSDELKNLYQEFLKMTNDEEQNLSLIQERLKEEPQMGAFLCEYGMFKKTYQLEKCRAERYGISVFLMLVTVEPLWDVRPESQAYMNLINDGMEKVEYVLLNRLRSGDVIARYSTSQYIALLPTCQYETAKMVSERIASEFEKRYRIKSKAKLHFGLEEVDVSDLISGEKVGDDRRKGAQRQ